MDRRSYLEARLRRIICHDGSVNHACYLLVVSAQSHSLIPALPLHLSLLQRPCLFHQARLLLPFPLPRPENSAYQARFEDSRPVPRAWALSDFRESVQCAQSPPWSDSRKIRGPQISVCGMPSFLNLSPIASPVFLFRALRPLLPACLTRLPYPPRP